MDFLQTIVFQRTLIVGLLTAGLCSFLGVLVVLRRMSFFSDAVSHAGLTGVAIGVILGVSPTLGAVAFCLLFGLLMIYLSEKKALQLDTVIGVLFSGSVALGIILLSRLPGYYEENLEDLLFGNISVVTKGDLLVSLALFIAMGVAVVLAFRKFGLVAFSRDLATVSDVSVSRWNYFWAGILSLTIALSIKIAGVILVSALIIVPAAAAKLISKNLREMVFWSVLFGVLGVFLGLASSSFAFDLPSGPAIVMVDVVFFILAWIIKK